MKHDAGLNRPEPKGSSGISPPAFDQADRGGGVSGTKAGER